MGLCEKMRLKRGIKAFVEKSIAFFTKYSDDILKVLGASAVVGLLVKIIKEVAVKNLHAKEELEKILEEYKKEKELTEELKKKIDKLSQEYPFIKGAFEKGMQELVEEEIEKQRMYTKELKEANMIWFATSNEVDKSDKEECLRIQQEASIALYGLAGEDGVAGRLNPEDIEDEKIRKALSLLQQFCDKYCDENGEVCLTEDGLLDESATNTDELSCFVVENGVFFNFFEPVEVTEETRAYFDAVSDALNILVAKESNKDVKDKYFSEFFLE